jgi:hypothetical protein
VLRVLILGFAFAAFPLASHAAMVQLGAHSEKEVQGACKSAGGSFWSNSSGYGCSKNNCDGKGGTCDVICHEGKCVGVTPIQHAGQLTLPQVLTLPSSARRGPPSPGMLETSPSGPNQGPPGVGTPKPTAPPGRLN